ncbi:Outer membrane protein OprM [Polaribacter huanghezhanensis]|uniref:TolC family protein n=1 Tax=Polaribacter huanghezhanensis TaxID=1354726 RepID=UPI00264717E1|nr:TolC family protein [Polaribacter huanghezhanensis]WKD85684.1 Outer membrane protein OprM [Polaribacter huanghezhanensis]
MQNKVLLFFSLCFIGLGFSQEKTKGFSLKEAVYFAIKNNYNVKTAQNDVLAAKEKKWETTTIGLPKISAKVDYQNFLKQVTTLLPAEITGGTPGTFVPVTFGTKQNVNAAITLNQLIFDGSYIVGLQSAKTYLNISKQAKEKTELSVREAVINAYGNVLIAEKSIEILKRNLVTLEKTLSDTQKIYKNGLTEEEDVEQLQITLTTVKNQLNKTIRLRDIGYKMLNISMGNLIDEKIVLTDNLDSLILGSIDLSLLAKNFNVANHIDYKIAENNKEGNRLLVLLEKSKVLPSLSAFVNYGYAGNADSFDFFQSNQQWYNSSLLGVSLKIPIFSSFERRSKTRQAQFEYDNSDIQLFEMKEQLNLQSAAAKSDYKFSIEQYQSAKQNLELAQRIEKKQQVKFFEGVSTSFELSQAQNQLYTQQQNYVQSMLEVIAKKAALENALNIPLNK